MGPTAMFYLRLASLLLPLSYSNDTSKQSRSGHLVRMRMEKVLGLGLVCL